MILEKNTHFASRLDVMRRAIFIIALSLLGLGCAQLLSPAQVADITSLRSGSYSLDKNHASLLFKVNHMGFAKYIGRFNRFDASLDFDREHFERATVDAVIDMASVDVNNTRFAETLRSSAWFDVKRYPKARFRTTSVALISESMADFTGDLNFLGRTLPVTIRVQFQGAGNNLLSGRYTLGFEAQGTFRRSNFGLDRYIPTIGDTIELEIHAEFQRQTSAQKHWR